MNVSANSSQNYSAVEINQSNRRIISNGKLHSSILPLFIMEEWVLAQARIRSFTFKLALYDIKEGEMIVASEDLNKIGIMRFPAVHSRE